MEPKAAIVTARIRFKRCQECLFLLHPGVSAYLFLSRLIVLIVYGRRIFCSSTAAKMGYDNLRAHSHPIHCDQE